VTFPVERLRELREERGLSQPKLAVALGVGLRSLVRWELGHAKPSPLALGALSAFFGDVERKGKGRAK
jgi:transcriptional regulator with XRE-family HTH domain